MSLIDSNCSEEHRRQLLQLALSGAQGAREVKLALRTESLASEAAAQWVQIAHRHRSVGNFSRRSWLAGACASLALIAVFSLHQSAVTPPARAQAQELASNLPDRFGAIASFEGNVAESDSFSRLSFEANQ